jgi:hypothetical protein
LPECRIELFVTEDEYDPICVIGEMGHVTASSNAGPRGKADMGLRARDEYENLILLCRNCHIKIDTLKRSYPEGRLQEIKANHEAWVRTALPERGFSSIRWKVLRLQGDFPFDPATIAEALSPDQSGKETQIKIQASRSSWTSIQDELRIKLEALACEEDSIASRIAVFPLAPISACIYTGYLLTNRMNVRGFQYHRDEATWAWPKTQQLLTTPTFLQTGDSSSKSAELFFSFQLTAPIDASNLRRRIGGDQAAYECSVPDLSTGWLKSKMQLDELARKARELFEVASIRFPQSPRWHILYAGPAPGAVVVGQQLNPTMIPSVQCYEFLRPNHIPSITITQRDSALTRWNSQTPAGPV